MDLQRGQSAHKYWNMAENLGATEFAAPVNSAYSGEHYTKVQ